MVEAKNNLSSDVERSSVDEEKNHGMSFKLVASNQSLELEANIKI